MASSPGTKNALVEDTIDFQQELEDVLKEVEFETVTSYLEEFMVYRPKILLDECVDHKFWYKFLIDNFSKEECGIQHVCKIDKNKIKRGGNPRKGPSDKDVIAYAASHFYEVIITSDRKDFPSENTIKSQVNNVFKKMYIRPNIQKKKNNTFDNVYIEELGISTEEYIFKIIQDIENYIETRTKTIDEELKNILY